MRRRRWTFLGSRLAWLLRPVAILLLRCVGWRAVGGLPEPRKLVIPAAPHTTNWDGLLLILLAMELRADLRWLGKKELFPWPFGWLMEWLGGVPVIRDRATKLTEQAAQVFAESDDLLLVITPEGTRSRVEYWKTGFYRIAQLAGVPLSLGFLDFSTRTGGLGPLIYPAPVSAAFDDPRVLADLDQMREFYMTKSGCHPENFGPVRFGP